MHSLRVSRPHAWRNGSPPVITTSQGIEGLGVSDGREAIVRNDADDLANSTVEVLTDSRFYTKLANNANYLVRNKFSWKLIADLLDEIYESVAHEKNN